MNVAGPNGGWRWHRVGVRNSPGSAISNGEPDLCHAYQATPAARLRRPRGIVAGARDGAIRPALRRNSAMITGSDS